MRVTTKVCGVGAGLHPQGSVEGGAEVAVCEDNLQGSQPKDRASSVSPRYYLKIQLNESSARPRVPENSGPFVVSEVRAATRTLGKGEGSHLVHGVSRLGTSQVGAHSVGAKAVIQIESNPPHPEFGAGLP